MIGVNRSGSWPEQGRSKGEESTMQARRYRTTRRSLAFGLSLLAGGHLLSGPATTRDPIRFTPGLPAAMNGGQIRWRTSRLPRLHRRVLRGPGWGSDADMADDGGKSTGPIWKVARAGIEEKWPGVAPGEQRPRRLDRRDGRDDRRGRSRARRRRDPLRGPRSPGDELGQRRRVDPVQVLEQQEDRRAPGWSMVRRSGSWGHARDRARRR